MALLWLRSPALNRDFRNSGQSANLSPQTVALVTDQGAVRQRRLLDDAWPIQRPISNRAGCGLIRNNKANRDILKVHVTPTGTGRWNVSRRFYDIHVSSFQSLQRWLERQRAA